MRYDGRPRGRYRTIILYQAISSVKARYNQVGNLDRACQLICVELLVNFLFPVRRTCFVALRSGGGETGGWIAALILSSPTSSLSSSLSTSYPGACHPTTSRSFLGFFPCEAFSCVPLSVVTLFLVYQLLHLFYYLILSETVFSRLIYPERQI